ncbi:MAG: C4-dicarboxylate transporter [Myxococcales bacterium]|nr:C4-dicarboxylate transporter [Myxococcales bacterium]
MKPRFYTTLYFRVLVAIALGIAVGAAFPDVGVKLEILGTLFIRLVKLTIGPLIFCTIVTGIAGVSGMKQVGKAGGLAILYFELASTVALAIGLVVVNIVRPGAGMNITPTEADAQRVAGFLGKKASSIPVLDWIPDLSSRLVWVLGIAIVVAILLYIIGAPAKPVVRAVDRVGHFVFRVIALLMQLAPIGAFGAMAFTVGKYGIGTLAALGELMACFYATCLLFVFGVLGTVARIHGFSIFRFVRYIREELFIVLGTSSSEAVLPRMIVKLEKLGASKSVAGLVVPAGYSFNLDGTAIYVTMAALFVAQATNTPLDLTHQLELLGLAMLTSKGAAAVTGSGFVTVAATVEAFGTIPIPGLALILGIDRFMSEARALTNVVGNGVATLVVARWCGELDSERLARELGAQKQQESR